MILYYLLSAVSFGAGSTCYCYCYKVRLASSHKTEDYQSRQILFSSGLQLLLAMMMMIISEQYWTPYWNLVPGDAHGEIYEAESMFA